MVYNIKKNKNLIISSSILAVINYNNIYCGYYGDTKNGTGGEKDKKGETPNGDEEQRQKAINVLLELFNDKKTKLEKKGKLGELKITEEQIKNIKEKSQFKNIFNELNNIKIHNDPEKNLVLDIDKISDLPYILKANNNDPLKITNFIKYVNDDIVEGTNEKNKQILENLLKQNKLYRFIKYDPSMFGKNEKNQPVPNSDYWDNNVYLLYIDKDTFSVEDCVNLGEFTNEDFQTRAILNSKIFENCYFLYTSLEKKEDIITIFKKKTIIDLDKLNSYPNIFCFIPSEDRNAAKSRFGKFLKKLNDIEVKNEDLENYYRNNAINVQINDKSFGIFNSKIDEIEFKGYKKSTEKPADYGTIDATKKFEIGITDSKGTTKYYFVKEEAK